MKYLKCLLSFMFACAFSTSSHAITAEQLQEYAANYNDAQLMEILMKYGNSKESPTLNLAMISKDYFAVVTLIEYGVDINLRYHTPPYNEDTYKNQKKYTQTVLEIAIEENEISLLEYFLLN